MIREFWVENFFSIRDRQVLNFESKSAPDAFSSSQVDERTRINKLAIIYGANASGKSNLLIALQEIFRLLVFSKGDIHQKIVGYRPFALLADRPTVMYVSFYAGNTRYDYQVSYDAERILNEILTYYPKGSKALFYQRDFVSDQSAANIKFGGSLGVDKETERTFITNTLNNHTVLSTYSKIALKENVAKISELYSWIMKTIHEVNGDQVESRTFAEHLKKVLQDPQKKQFYLQMVRKADFNIFDMHYSESPRSLDDETRNKIRTDPSISENYKRFLLEGPVRDIIFTNRAGGRSFDLMLRDQSAGTLAFLDRIDFLYDTINGDHTYFLDEPESDLHYDLFLFYLNAFLYNSTNAQLIFASHLTTLLAEDLINEERDLVFFVEKDPGTAASVVMRGDKFGLHKNQSLYNAYKLGKLGAKPELGSPFILAE